MKPVRNNTIKIPRSAVMEIHVSLITFFPGRRGDERQYIEIREYYLDAEAYGHGIVVPLGLTPELRDALSEVFAV